MTRYAEGTTVSVEKTKAEIEATLKRFGAEAFGSAWQGNRAMIEFQCRGKRIRFLLTLPDRDDARFTQDPRNKWRKRAAGVAERAWDAECRRVWRSFAMGIKAKLAAVEDGIFAFEQEFMPHIVMPDGQTVAEHVGPRIEAAYAEHKMLPLLPAPGDHR